MRGKIGTGKMNRWWNGAVLVKMKNEVFRDTSQASPQNKVIIGFVKNVRTNMVIYPTDDICLKSYAGWLS